MSKRRGNRPTPGARAGRRRSLVQRLEPRILLSADLPLLAPPGDPSAAPQELQLDGETTGQTTELHTTRHELVFVDAGVEDHADLLGDLRARSGDDARFDVYVLDGARDGLTQINEVLAGYDGDLDAVHVVSHGTDAGVQLGATWLTSDSLSERANDVLGWGDAFSKEADLLFYGCDLAGSAEGRSLVDQLAVMTGTDVAASVDATGASELGGDWDLEYAAGTIETTVAFSQGLQASFASVLDGTAIWAEAGSSVPETSDFDGSSFGADGATVDVGGEWRVIAGAEAPTRDEKIVIGVNAAGKIDTMVWDGSTWIDTSPALLPIGTVSDPEKWSFDVAYESQSGDAVFTYNNGFGLIGYSVWDGSTWSFPGAVPQAEAGEAHQMKLAANPNSDEMILIVSNTFQEDYAAVWNGSSWGNSIDLHNTGNPVGHTDVAVTYEQQSGHAMLVWGEHDDSVHYSFWDGTSFSAEQTLDPPAGLSGDVVWTSIASDPTTDRIVLGVGTASNETWVAVWDGSAWQAPQAAASNSPHSDRQAVAVAFESGSGQAIAAYSTTTDQVAYQTWTSGAGWSGELVGPDLGDHADSLTLDADPSSNTVMLSVVDIAKDVSFVAWDGSSWGTPSQQEANAGTNRGQPFLFLWDQVSSNVAPTANPDSASVNEGASVVIDLAGNDTDPDNALDLASIVITSGPANGALVDNGDGTLTYTHDGSETIGDSFSYTIDDVAGATSNVASVTVTINPQNDAPTANPNSASVNEGSSVVIDLSGNDTDPDNALDLSSIVVTSGPANGTLVDNGDGTLTYTHDGSETVGDSFSYTIDDVAGATSNIASVTVTVSPQNDAPTAANDSASVNEGTSVIINLSGNDTDPDNALDLSSIVVTSGPANGTLVDNGDGTLTYTHDGSETVGDSFSYTIDDISGATSSVASVTVTVNPQNDAPTAADDSASVNEGASVIINLSGNDTDPDNALDLSSIVITSGPANGTLVDNGDGTLTYTHDGSETIGDSFSYTIDDISGATSNVASVTVTVNPQNDAPTAANDSASANEGASVIINLSGNDTDPDNALDLGSIVVTSGPANGTLVDNGDGTLTYTHDGSETVGDSFSYTIDDVAGATSNIASVAVTVNPQNDAPTAANDSASVNEGASVIINLSGNDTDSDNALDLSSIVVTSGPANGTLVDNGDGTLTYTHDGSETVGDSFSYTIDDISGATSNVASVTVTVNPQNDAPTAANDSASVNEGSSVIINLTGNDTDPDNALDLSSIVVTSGPANGTLVDNGDGTLTYTHDGSETVGDSFSYTIDDVSGATSNVASVTVTVNPQNDAPTAANDSASVNEGTSVIINLSGNDTDPDNALDLGSIVVTSGPANGTLVDNGDGTLTYTHDGFETIGDSFSYTIDDVAGATSNIASVTVTVNPQNDAPTAANDSASVNEGASVTINLSGNDTDPDNALDLSSIVVTSGPANGTLVDNGDGTLTYTHDGSETVGDSFSYTIDDISGATSNIASVTVTVNPQNDAPTANPDAATVDEGASVVIDLAGNDVDPEGSLDLSSVVITSGPAVGTLVDNGDGTVTYTHDGSETLADGFSYTIDDASGATSNVASVSLTINPQNDAPVLTTFGPALATISEDATTNSGATVATIVGGSISDADTAPVEGVAVTRISSGNGSWQYSTDGGATWGAVGSVANTNALLLRDSDRIRFVPDSKNADSASIDYRAWDRTSGVVATKVSTGTNGGPTSFSTAVDSAAITVTGLNDAPALGNATLAPFDGSASNAAGATIGSLFSAKLSDVDAGSSLGGIAVVGNGAPASDGTWEYSSDGGTSWSAVGSVADGASALALAPSTHLRFVPAAGFTGTPTALTVRGLDDTYGGGFATNPGGTETRIYVNTSSNGGTSAIAGNTAGVSVQVLTGVVEAGVAEGTTAEPTAPEIDEAIENALDDDPQEETENEAGAEPAPADAVDSGTPSSPGPVSLRLITGAGEPEAPFEWPLPSEPTVVPTGSLERSEASPLSERPSELRREAAERAQLSGPLAQLEGLVSAFGDDLAFLNSDTGFLEELDRMRNVALDQVELERAVVGSSVAMTAGLSIGYVVWLTRGGLLLASMASSIPVWRLVDPIPILASLALRNEEEGEDAESLDSMVRDGETPDDDAAEPEAGLETA